MSIAGDIKNTFRGNNNGLSKLIFINVLLFITGNLIIGISKISGYNEHFVYNWLGLHPALSMLLYRPWTILTYMFLQVEVMHIFYNMLWLYWMGKLFVEFIGSKQLINTYILGGLSGGILFIVAAAVAPASVSDLPLIGSSASVMAIIVGAAFLLPNYPIQLIFIGEIKLKYIALAAFVLTSIIDLTNNTGGKIAHIGGAIYGYAFFVQYRKGIDPGAFISRLFSVLANRFKTQHKMKVVHKRPVSDEEYNSTRRSAEKRIDEILDKISRSGYDSLNREEKDFLFKQGNRN